MLPAAHRLRSSDQFAETLRRGRRAGAGTLVVHAHARGGDGAARAGLVVSKKVGNSVVRHRVARRLRALLAARLPSMAAGTDVVVRALPPAATASSAELGTDLDGAWRRITAGGGGRR